MDVPIRKAEACTGNQMVFRTELPVFQLAGLYNRFTRPKTIEAMVGMLIVTTTHNLLVQTFTIECRSFFRTSRRNSDWILMSQLEGVQATVSRAGKGHLEIAS